MSKKALISGITGQTGSYLAELLLDKGYEVHGILRRVGLLEGRARVERIYPILDRIQLHQGDVTCLSSIYDIFHKVQPDECYHLAAQSFVASSFDDPAGTLHTNVDGTLNMLMAIKNVSPACKFYFAGSSEMFGKVKETPQTELTPFHPRSPYGISKVAGFELTRNYREAYGLHCSSGILFNHEGTRRGSEFVTQKIAQGAAKIKYKVACGFENIPKLKLGNLDAKRDWGYAKEYAHAQWLMLQQEQPDDYVVATGETHSIKEFCDAAFKCVDLNWEDWIEVDPKFLRPAEVDLLVGGYSKAKRVLGWAPTTTFNDLVKIMMDGAMEEYA